eukprot:jgi/Mesvir1/10019/Mv03642-RA.1
MEKAVAGMPGLLVGKVGLVSTCPPPRLAGLGKVRGTIIRMTEAHLPKSATKLRKAANFSESGQFSTGIYRRRVGGAGLVVRALSGSEGARAGASNGKTESNRAESWDKITSNMAQMATLPFLLLLMPQILKNAQNLIAGKLEAVSILPWMAYFTGLLGNMLLLTYFAEKHEKSAVVVQSMGVITTAVLLSQIFLGGFMPFPAFALMSAVTAAGLVLNYLDFAGMVPPLLWAIWKGFIGVTGLAVLPQVIWATFTATTTIIPAVVTGLAGAVFYIQDKRGALPQKLRGVWSSMSAWTATLLFMFMPIAQLLSCFNNPSNLANMSITTTLLGMSGNALMIARALYTRDIIWLTGTVWAVAFMGWGVLFSMFVNKVHINAPVFCLLSAVIVGYLGTAMRASCFRCH